LENLDIKNAENIVNKATVKALELNISVNIALVDYAGYLLSFKRMDGALLGAIDIAVRKAKTAALFQKPNHILGDKSQPSGPLYQIEHSNGGLITFAGGLPIINDNGNVIAAIGVSGSTIENDLVVAKAGVE